MPVLVDTNVLVYRYDPRFPEKQRIARDRLRAGIADGNLRVPHQAVIEFVAAVTRPLKGLGPLMSANDAWREAEKFLVDFVVLYPNDDVVRTAIRGAATYRLSWFDAQIWAYADCFRCAEILSEDFQAGRMYGGVRIVDPFQ